MNTVQILGLYAGIQASAVGVGMLLTEMVKPTIDEFLDPLKGIHDTTIELSALLFSLLTVAGLTWAGPGFGNLSDVAAVGVNTVIAVAAEFGIYAKVRGPAPATPTAKYLNALATAHGTEIVDAMEAQGRLSKVLPDSLGINFPAAGTRHGQQPKRQTTKVSGALTPDTTSPGDSTPPPKETDPPTS